MVDEMSRLRRKLKRIERKLDRKPRRAVKRGAAGTVADMKRNVIENDAVASTELFRGIGYSTEGENRIIIESEAGHSGFVEFGTGPKHIENPYTDHYSKPSFSGRLVAALTRWAAVKPTIPTDDVDPFSIGWAVARSISGEAEGSIGGQEPQPFFIPAWEQNRPAIVAMVDRAVERALKG